MKNGAPGKGVDGGSDGAGSDEMGAALAMLNQFKAFSSFARSFSNVTICEWRTSITSSRGLPSEMPMIASST